MDFDSPEEKEFPGLYASEAADARSKKSKEESDCEWALNRRGRENGEKSMSPPFLRSQRRSRAQQEGPVDRPAQGQEGEGQGPGIRRLGGRELAGGGAGHQVSGRSSILT